MNPYREAAICDECNGLGWVVCPCSPPGHWFRCFACNPDRTRPPPMLPVEEFFETDAEMENFGERQ